MFSRSFAAALIVTTCTAAAAGSYLALRQNAAEAAPAPPLTEVERPEPPPSSQPATTPEPAAAEPVTPDAAIESPKAMRPAFPRRPSTPPVRARQVPVTKSVGVESSAVTAPVTVETAEPVAAAPTATVPEGTTLTAAPAEISAEPTPAASAAGATGAFEIVVPSSAVIGLEIENTISSEQAQVEDKVEARVTRDVYADGRLAIPAGSKVIGAVSVVERGGKLKDRARLGVRFHTLVLAGGHQVPMRTEAIYREGDSPGAESTRKIGGAAIGGAVLGAILGGGKGAVTGASVGAAGGTAAVMVGGRNPATLAGGSVVTVRLSAPVTLVVER
jgi:type IV secretory pathway VirB10-like protein